MAAGLVPEGREALEGPARAYGLAAAAPPSGRGGADPGPRPVDDDPRLALAMARTAARRFHADRGGRVGGSGPKRSSWPPRSSSVGPRPRLLSRRGRAARRRAGDPGPGLAGDHRPAAQRAGPPPARSRPTAAGRVRLGLRTGSERSSARRTAARRRRPRRARRGAGPPVHRALGPSAPWARRPARRGRARSAASTCRPTSSATGRRLGRARPGPGRRLAEPRGALRVVRAGADAGQPGAAGAGAAGRVDRRAT